MYGAVDAEDVGVKVVCSGAAAINVEIVFVLFPAPCSIHAYILAIEQVAVDSRARPVISKMLGILFVVSIEHSLVAELSREWEVG